MKPVTKRALVGLNVVLLGTVAFLATSQHADAQAGARARGTYTMVSGKIQGANTDVVYVIDTSNQELISFGWDIATNDLRLIGYRDLVADNKGQRTPR